jgi:hypothetical protein
MTEVRVGIRFGLYDVDPETSIRSNEVSLHGSMALAQAAAQASVRAPITWINDAAGDTIGIVRGKTCFKIELGMHIKIQKRAKLMYVIPLPWSVFENQFRPGQNDTGEQSS